MRVMGVSWGYMGKIRVVAGWLYVKIRVVVVGYRWKHKGGLWSTLVIIITRVDHNHPS